MKPHTYTRRGKGYCCIWCDGPLSRWKRITKKSAKRADKNIAKKMLAKEMASREGFDPSSGD